jgi:hypothetical protein
VKWSPRPWSGTHTFRRLRTATRIPRIAAEAVFADFLKEFAQNARRGEGEPTEQSLTKVNSLAERPWRADHAGFVYAEEIAVF